MAEIISISQKRQISKAQKAVLVKKQKILAVQKVFQCTHCAYKCEKCGTQIQKNHLQEKRGRHRPQLPYRFCNSCYEEYLDYIERLQGRGAPDCYWHNKEWLRVWRAWIDYQGSIDAYLKSNEFTKLLDELKQTRPDE